MIEKVTFPFPNKFSSDMENNCHHIREGGVLSGNDDCLCKSKSNPSNKAYMRG